MKKMFENPILRALTSATGLLDRLGIPYMVFGGIANSIYGNPRQTFDIDIKIIIESSDDLNRLFEELDKVGKIIPPDPAEFVKETNVIPVDIHDVRVDLVIAELPFEKDAVNRNRKIEFFGVKIKVCTPEDLIIQKAVSVREKDWGDIRYIIENRGNELDWDYLSEHCKDLARFLDDPEIFNRVERWKN